MNLLVIGGTGFFGKSILDSFKRGKLNKFSISKVIILARNIEKFIFDYPELNFEGVEFVSGDISILSNLPISDYIIHAATSTNINDYKEGLEHLIQYNIEKSASNFCNLVVKNNINSKILYCSSGAVYGKQPINLEKITEDFNFQNNLSELNLNKKAYCLGKRFAENEFIKLSKLGFNVSIARCFAFYGKYLPKDKHFAYGNFIEQAEKGETIIVSTNGIVYRSYMEADDLVESLLSILLISSNDCPIINVGSDEQLSLYELAKNIAFKYQVDFKFLNHNENEIIDRYIPNTEKLKKILKIK